MAALNSIRDFHDRLTVVCDSLENLFLVVNDEYRDLTEAARPAMILFRDLLDQGDKIAGPDSGE